jgi:hypothetical protein
LGCARFDKLKAQLAPCAFVRQKQAYGAGSYDQNVLVECLVHVLRPTELVVILVQADAVIRDMRPAKATTAEGIN